MNQSQYGEDQWILDNINLPKRGKMIDVGAYDGLLFSNSLAFEKLNWYGLLIEPNIELKDILKKNRIWPSFCPYAIDLDESPKEMVMDGLYSHFGTSNTKVDCITLDSLVRAFNLKELDILSIDTEGNDLRVWQSLTLIRPKVVIIEHEINYKGSKVSNFGGIAKHATYLGYSLKLETACNCVFVDGIFEKELLKYVD